MFDMSKPCKLAVFQEIRVFEEFRLVGVIVRPNRNPGAIGTKLDAV